MGTLILTLFITGIPAFVYNKKRGIISLKEIYRFFTKIAAVSSVGFTLVIYLFILTNDNVRIDFIYLIIMVIVIYLAMVLTVFLAQFIIMILGFGIIGIMSAIIRGITPEILLHMSRITKSTTDSMKDEDLKMNTEYKFIAWFYLVPETLDTKTLSINKGKLKKEIDWNIVQTAMLWQIFFGMIVVVYISLNPFLLETIDIQTLFNIATNFTYFIPMLVLPWFIFLRLNARIKAPINEFKLYNGIKDRMTRLLVALGTLIIIIRLALRDVNFDNIILMFGTYFFFFVIGVLFFTFVYFNFFENDLAKDIARRYSKIKDKKTKK
jgi:hypothetical protein